MPKNLVCLYASTMHPYQYDSLVFIHVPTFYLQVTYHYSYADCSYRCINNKLSYNWIQLHNRFRSNICKTHKSGVAKKNSGGRLEGSEGETHIRVLLGANPRKSSNNRFLNNYKAELALKQHLTCGTKLAYVHNLFSFFIRQYF